MASIGCARRVGKERCAIDVELQDFGKAGRLQASLHQGFASKLGEVAMKKCPECYAIMKQTVADLPRLSFEEHPSNDVAKVRYECSQCGHFEDSLPPLKRTLVNR
jgi:predicted nucleic acid-binding Zn ribbon protein